MKNTNSFALLSGIILALAGCESAPSPARAPNQTVSITAKLPVIVALPETKEAQEKGGIEIAIVPVSYQAVKKTRTTTVQVQPTFGEQVALSLVTNGNSQSKVMIEQTNESHLTIDPPRLAFTVRINNKLNRVFRGQGAVVQINVDGKMLSFDHIDYKQFINGIVPPRNEASVSISADALSLLPEKGTIGIYLYDVITATDNAGNTIEKQNYEWFFSYTTKIVEERSEISVVHGSMDVETFQSEINRERQEREMGAAKLR